MTDTKLPEPPAPFSTAAEVSGAWASFRGGATVRCPVDDGPVALSVDGAAGSYRFVCTSCGISTPWFESGPLGLNVRWHLSGAGKGDE